MAQKRIEVFLYCFLGKAIYINGHFVYSEEHSSLLGINPGKNLKNKIIGITNHPR